MKKFLSFVFLVVLLFCVSVNVVFATLTLSTNSVTTDGTLSLNGVAASAYTLGAATTTGSITIGGTAQTGNIILGQTTTTPIGIGTISPGAGLDIQPAVTASGGVAYATRFQQTLTAAANSDALTALYINPTFNDNSKSSVSHYGLVVANGQVGIGGVPDFGVKLNVTTGGTAFNIVRVAGTGSTAVNYFEVQEPSATNGYLILQAAGTGAGLGNAYGVSLNGAVLLETNFNTGTNPTAFLIGNNRAVPLIFGTSNTEVMRLTASTANVLIGTTTDTAITGVKLRVSGGIEVTGTVNTTNCSSSGGTCGAAPSGSVTIAAAATTVTVATTAVTANSNIIISEDSSLGTRLGVTCNTTLGRTYAVTTRTAATSFVITSSAAPSTNPACLSYWIVN